MRRAVAILAALTTGCATAATAPLPDLAHAPPADAGEAVGCTAAAPCAQMDGVCMSTSLSAYLGGMARCCADCQAKLKTCDRVASDNVAKVLILIGGVVAGAATVAAGYEIRDWWRSKQ